MHTENLTAKYLPSGKELFGAAAGVTILQEYKNSGKVLKPASQRLALEMATPTFPRKIAGSVRDCSAPVPGSDIPNPLQLNFLPQKDNPTFFTVNFPYYLSVGVRRASSRAASLRSASSQS